MPIKVENSKRFRFNKATGRIVQQQNMKLLVTRGNSLSVVIETPLLEDVNKYPLSITSIDTTFTMETYQTLNNFLCQNEEKNARIEELEEQLNYSKKEKASQREFKACAEKVKEELNVIPQF
jgi:hypothetical protein